MKSNSDVVKVVIEAKFSFRDRVLILFGATLKTQISTPISYNMRAGLTVHKSIVKDDVSFFKLTAQKRKEIEGGV